MKKKYATAQPSSIPPDQVLTTQALTKAYFQGDYHIKAVDSVYLNVKKGEFVAIVGASGSGKSTLLHLLAGLDRPTSGMVWVSGKDIYNMTDDEFSVLQKTESYEDEYTDMWKTFFHSISIEQRKNYICQRNLFPIWKRKHAVEFR